MPGSPTASLYRRAAIALIAAYGLLLQAFITVATPPVLSAEGVFCPAHTSDSSGSDVPAAACERCCILAQQAAVAPSPVPTVTPWRRPSAGPIVWRPEAALLRTGPPRQAHRPRGPPIA